MSEDYKRHPDKYARFRPRYPANIFSWLSEIAPDKEIAWDCATGSGQAAIGLAKYFAKVVATDINQSQIDHAIINPKIEYQVCPAEKTSIVSGSVSVITVACAVHWFDLPKFYEEVRRTLKAGGILAVWTYEWPWLGNERIDSILKLYRDEILGKYWPENSRLYFERYETLYFPFEEIKQPSFSISCDWNASDLLGFLETWSGPQRYLREQKTSSADLIRDDLLATWNAIGQQQGVVLPLYFRVGRMSV